MNVEPEERWDRLCVHSVHDEDPVRTMRFACFTILALALAACGGDSGNVMAADANMLSPEQVDAALGPELANSGNEIEVANDVSAPQPVATDPEDAAEPEPAPATEPEPQTQPEEEPAADTAPPANNITEE